MNLGLTYDDVALIPRYNNIPSRLEPDLSTNLTTNVRMKIPILCANMDSTIGTELARVLVKNGSTPIFHRFCSYAQKVEWVEKFPLSFMSMGIKKKDLNEITQLLERGLKGIIIDVAHSHCQAVKEIALSLRDLKRKYPFELIIGNICTPRAVHDLYNWGADGIKVGIGPGYNCTTSMVAASGVPQFTTVQMCAEEAKTYGIPIIADGGIRSSRELTLALGAGASSVMIGSLFAATYCSSAVKTPDGSQAKYRGQASADFQEEFFGEVKKGTVPEGISSWMKVTGSAQDLIDNLLGGLRSGLTYSGSRDIEEFHKKAEFIQVTPSYLRK